MQVLDAQDAAPCVVSLGGKQLCQTTVQCTTPVEETILKPSCSCVAAFRAACWSKQAGSRQRAGKPAKVWCRIFGFCRAEVCRVVCGLPLSQQVAGHIVVKVDQALAGRGELRPHAADGGGFGIRPAHKLSLSADCLGRRTWSLRLAAGEP